MSRTEFSSTGATRISGSHSRLTQVVRPRLEGKQRTPLSSRVATCISWMMSCHRFRCLSRWVGHINQTGQWWGRRQSARYHLLSSGSLGMSRSKPGIIRASVLLKRRQNARFWLNNTMEFYFLFSKMEALAGIETQTERMDRWTQDG